MTAPDRRTGAERRSNWADATARLTFDLLDDLIALERRMRQRSDVETYWANELAAIIRRHQEP